MVNRIFQFALERRCKLQWKNIEGINIDSAMVAMQKAADAHSRGEELGRSLCDRLHAYGSHTDPAIRRAALSLRRDVHNQRLRSGDIGFQLQQELDAETRQALDQWLAVKQEAASLSSEARAAFKTGLSEARRVIAGLVLYDDAFACGLQTANRRIYDQALYYAQAIGMQRQPDKKLRNTEDRLVSFIYKVVAKPTPFASFAEILVRAAPGSQPFANARREVRIARDLLLWLQAQCIDGFPGLGAQLPIRLNNTIKITEERIELFTRGRDGTPGMLGAERFVELKRSAALDLVLDAFTSARPNLAMLAGEFTARGFSEGQAQDYLASLVRAGLLELDFGIPDQAGDFPARAAAILNELQGQVGQPFAALFGRLAQLEQAIGAAHNAQTRQPLLRVMGDCLAEFATALGTDPEPLRNVRDLYFEDVGGCDRESASALLANDAERDALGNLTPLLILFDAQLTSRLSLATLFCERYGADATVGLLDFYKDYRATPKEELFARLEPGRDAGIAAVVRLRREFCARVSAALAAGREVDLASDGFADLLARLPAHLDMRSVSMFVQRIAHDGPGLVLNSAGTGFGSAMSRFAHLFDGDHGTLAEALAAHLAHMPGAEHAHDICAVLAANSNLHSPLFEREIVYPGSQAREDGVAVSLREVQVSHRNGRLVLQRADTGEPLDLLSLNFIHPAAGPVLYRFLHLFSSHWVYRGYDLLRALLAPGMRVMPRLRLGPVVLCRKTWLIPAGEVHSVTAGTADEFDMLLALDAWRTARGLPRRVFYRATVTPPAQADMNSIEQVMALRQGRLRKPHMLDFQNPFLVRVFLKQVATLGPDVLVHVQECLPDLSDAPDAGPVHELLIQIERGH